MGDAGYWLDLQALDLVFFSTQAKRKHCVGFKGSRLESYLEHISVTDEVHTCIQKQAEKLSSQGM